MNWSQSILQDKFDSKMHTLTLIEENRVKKPTIQPSRRVVYVGELIYLDCADKEATIMYTLNDATLPTSFNGRMYDKQMRIPITGENYVIEIKCVACKRGFLDSEVSTKTY